MAAHMIDPLAWDIFHEDLASIPHFVLVPTAFEPRREKTGFRGFRPGPT